MKKMKNKIDENKVNKILKWEMKNKIDEIKVNKI